MFLTTAPLWVSGALLVGVPTLLAMAGPIVVRRYVSLDRLTTNNEVAGFADSRGVAILSEILHQLSVITEARRARLVKASGIVPDIIWLVLFGGAVLTIGFTFFFGAENLRAQSMMTGALALLIFSGLLVIVSIDHPFTGVVKVEPVAIFEVLEDLGRSHAVGR